MATGHEDELKKKNWAGGRRNMPMSPTTMAVGGILLAGTIGYFMFYNKDKDKNHRLETDRDLGRKFVDNTTTQPPPPRS